MVPIFEQMAKTFKFKRVLDIGCGNGFFTQWFKSHGSYELVGIDGSEYGLAEASSRGFDEVVHEDKPNKHPFLAGVIAS